MLFTTVANEAGSVTESLFPQEVPPSNTTYLGTLTALLDPSRANTIFNSSLYALSSTGTDVFRETFERVVTDGAWRCAVRYVAAQWVKSGGKAWVGEWKQGVSYADQVEGGFCTMDGRVCHEVSHDYGS